MRISVHYSLAPGSAKDLPIRMRLSYDGRRLDLRTGYVCPTEKWDEAAMRVKAGTSNRYGESASIINMALSKMETVITNLLTRYELDGQIPDPSTLKADFDRAMGRKPRRGSAAAIPEVETFEQIYRRYLSQHSRNIAPRTAQGYENVLARIEDAPFASRPIDMLTMKDLSDLLAGLYDDGLENQSISTYLSKIRTFLRWARREGIYHGTLHDDFHPKLKGLGKKDIHYLEWDEFLRMLNADLPMDKLRSVRDSFCFSCCTGLRVSDCNRLLWRDVHLDDSPDYIKIVTQKTSQPIKIELNQYSRLILQRQIDNENGKPQDPSASVFDQYGIKLRNKYLSRIAHLVGLEGQVRVLSFSGNSASEKYIDKADAITTHWGRHTFVVHALHLGISVEVIASWTGHTTTAGLKPYIAISEQTKQRNMLLFDGPDSNRTSVTSAATENEE